MHTMKLSILNSEYQQKSCKKNSFKWNIDLNKHSDDFLLTILDILETDFEEELNDDNKMNLALCVLSFFRELKKHGGEQFIYKINFIQLEFYSHLGVYFNNRGLFNHTFNCILCSLSDEYKLNEEIEYQLERLIYRNDISSKYIKMNFENVLIEFFTCLFYYSYKHGGHKEIASDVYDHFVDHIIEILKRNPTFNSIMCCCFTLTWSQVNNKNNEILIISLEEIYFNVNVSDGLKKLICMQFAGGAYKKSKLSGKEWASQCKQKYEQNLECHEKLHLLSMLYAEEKINNREVDEICNAIDEYHEFFKINNLLNVRYELNRIAPVMSRIINNLLTNKKIEFFIKIIGKFYGVDSNDITDSNIVIISPNFREGMFYSKQDDSFLVNKNMEKASLRLIEITNKFFNTQLVSSDISNSTVQKAERIGVPDQKYGQEFENYLIEHYEINKIPDKFFEKTKAILPIANYNHPLQGLLLKYRNEAKPVKISLAKELPERKIQNIKIWSYGTYTSEMEVKYICQLFSSNSINFEVLEGEHKSKKDFLKAYFDNNTDIFWVSSHGEYDDYNPHSVHLVINEHEIIPIDEIRNYKSNQELKRLLVLNICNGGRVHVDSGLLNLGLASEITNKYQDVIANKWPVDPKAAMVFGILLTTFLIKEKNYFEAHIKTIRKMIGGKNEILNALNMPELFEVSNAVENTTLDWENIIYWGSPSYFC